MNSLAGKIVCERSEMEVESSCVCKGGGLIVKAQKSDDT